MNQQIINHPKLKVWVKSGSEGPRHDPYAYEELEVKTPQGHVILHNGLGTWLVNNGVQIEVPPTNSEKWLRTEAFTKLTGYTTEQLGRIAWKLSSRCRKCGGREFYSASGYPGETFECCSNCHEVVSTCFDISAVI